MDLYRIEELKNLKQGDEIYVKYLEMPSSRDSNTFEGTCKVMVNNDEMLTTNKENIELDYSEIDNSEFAVEITENKSLQIYKA